MFETFWDALKSSLSWFSIILAITIFLEGFVTNRFKKKSIKKLDEFWNNLRNSNPSVLGKKEAILITTTYNKHFKNGKWLVNILHINISLLLTTICFLIGSIIYSGHLIKSGPVENQISDLTNYVIWGVFYSILLSRFWVALKNGKKRKKILFNWLLRYVYFLFWKKHALIPLILLTLKTNSNDYPFDQQLVALSIVIFITLELFLGLNKRHNLLVFALTYFLLILMETQILDGRKESFFYWVYDSMDDWAINFVFDLLTLSISLWLFERMIKSLNSLSNFWFFLLDLLVAGSLAVFLYWFFPALKNVVSEFCHHRELLDFSSNWDKVVIDNAQKRSDKNYLHLLYSISTLIPTIIIFLLVVIMWLAQTIKRYFGQFTGFIFYRKKKAEKTSPIFLSGILLAVVIAIVDFFIQVTF